MYTLLIKGFPGDAMVKNPPANIGDIRGAGSIPGSRRSAGERNCNSLQYSCLENSMDSRAWWATVHGVAKSWTGLKWLSTAFSTLLIIHLYMYSVSSVQFSCSVMSDSLGPHELQHARPPYPSPTPRVYSNSCPLSWWCHPAISSSVISLSSCTQSLPASGSFPMKQLFAWGGQRSGVSASASVLPMNIQDWSLLGWTAWVSLQSKGLSRVLSNTTVQKHQFFGAHLSSQSNSHIHTWPVEKP